MTGGQSESGAVETTTSMLMVIDAGNTNTVVGLCDTGAGSTDISVSWRLASTRERTAAEWFAIISPLLASTPAAGSGVSGMIVSSVVPAITTAIVELGRRFLNLDALLVSSAMDLGISVKTDNPAEVGTDRLVNGAYAFARFGGPTIVVDLGTATKIEAISDSGEFLGGIIAPGLGLSLETLASRAARLYAVELRHPPAAIGRNTIAAVQAGVVTGHIAMIEGMVDRVKKELGGANHVVLTGGFSGTISEDIRGVTDYVPDLTLSGLRYLYVRNA